MGEFKKFEGGQQFIWNAHDIDNVLRCPRYYQLSVLEGYRLKAFGAAPVWGTAVHYGTEILDTGEFDGMTKDAALNWAVAETVEKYAEELSQSDDSARTLETALRAVVGRADQFWGNSLKTAALPDGKPALEVEFECPIPTLEGHRFRGRIDKVAEMDGELYMVDLKTTKTALTARFFSYYFPNNQVMAYLWATKNVIGLPVKGFVIDGVQTGASFTRFGRHLIEVTDAQLNEWETSMVGAIETVTDYYEEGHYPVNFASCGNYGGCPYQRICSLPPSMRQTWLDEDYTKKLHREMDVTDD